MCIIFQVTETGNLVIHNAQKSDDGDYVCRAVNMVGSKDSEPAKLNVQGKLYYFFVFLGYRKHRILILIYDSGSLVSLKCFITVISLLISRFFILFVL